MLRIENRFANNFLDRGDSFKHVFDPDVSQQSHALGLGSISQVVGIAVVVVELLIVK